MSPQSNRLVFVVDDDEAVRESMLILLDAEGIAAQAFAGARDLLAGADLARAACLILDVHMPETSGIELLAELRRQGVTTPVVVMSGRSDHTIALAAERLGATMLAKPPDDEVLIQIIETALAAPT
ncbi:MAG: response regulator [Rhizomicrobium sp.]